MSACRRRVLLCAAGASITFPAGPRAQGDATRLRIGWLSVVPGYGEYYFRPARFEFIVNSRTANAIDVRVPRSVLLQATEVIE